MLFAALLALSVMTWTGQAAQLLAAFYRTGSLVFGGGHVVLPLLEGEFRDFGVFEVVTRKSRIGRNPNKPEDTVEIPTRRVVKFKPSKKLKQLVLDARS